jgi:hypothetical protein
MEKNLLIEEIYRIHEMMGVSTNKVLITEGFEDDIIRYLARNADQALNSAQKITKLRELGGFSKLTDNEVENLFNAYAKATPANEARAIGNIISAMDTASVRAIASSIYVNSIPTQQIVSNYLDSIADDWARGAFATIDDAKKAFEAELRAGLGTPPPGFSRIYDEVVNARLAGLESRLRGLDNPGKNTVDDVVNDVDDVQYTSQDYNLDKVKSEMQKAYNQAYSENKLPKSADGTPMPQKPGDEFFDFYAKQFNRDLTEYELVQIRKALIAQFGSDPKTLADKLKVFTKTLGYGPGIVKLLVEFVTIPAGALVSFIYKHKGAITTVLAIAGATYFVVDAYQTYKAGGDDIFDLNKGKTLYCWQNNVLTINDFDLDIQTKIVDSTGIDCVDFDGTDESRIPIKVYSVESPNTGLLSYFVEYKDGHKDEFDQNVAKKSSTPVVPPPPVVPPSGTYTNDPTGYKKYAEDKGGTYGTNGNYVMQDNLPFYKDSYGEWQQGSYDGTTFITN